MTLSTEGQRIRIADMLEKNSAYTPTKHKQPPLWVAKPSDELRAVMAVAHLPRMNYGPKDPELDVPEGMPLVEIDTNGAFVAAASSATFAHCELTNTGPLDLSSGTIPAGYMLVDAHQWMLGSPGSPLGSNRPRLTAQGRVWVPHTAYALLRDLVHGASWTGGGHWPDATVYDSWTADNVRFTKWAEAVRDLRAAAKRAHDKETGERIKLGYSQTVQMWATKPDPKGVAAADRKKKNFAYRPDWNAAIHGQHFANMFRTAYQAAQMNHAPIKIWDTDRMIFEKHHLLAVLGAPKSPLRLDETQIQIGTYKRLHEWYAGIEDM